MRYKQGRRAIIFFSLALMQSATASENPQLPSQLCIAEVPLGYRLAAKSWIPATFDKQTYILRLINNADRQNFSATLAAQKPVPTYGLFDFRNGNLNGWCSIYSPPFIKPKLFCDGSDGSLHIDIDSGKFEKFDRGGYIDGTNKTVSVELGLCNPI